MRRFGMLEPDLLAVVGNDGLQRGLADGHVLRIEGLALHLPLAHAGGPPRLGDELPRGTSSRVIEVQGWAKTWRAALEGTHAGADPGRGQRQQPGVSHLTDDELRSMRGLEPDVSVNARVGTRLWLGDGAALSARGTILAVPLVGPPIRRQLPAAQGLKRRAAPGRGGGIITSRDGRAHPRGVTAATAIAAGTGALKPPGAVGHRSKWGDKLLWFAEPHMQVSMLAWLPESTLREGLANGLRSPSVGDTLDCRGAYTTALFDAVPRRRMISIPPTRDDPVAASSSEVAGGPAGSRVLLGTGWWNALRVPGGDDRGGRGGRVLNEGPLRS